MEKMIVRPIDDKNRIVIPPEMLKEAGLEQGDHVILKSNHNKIYLVKAEITEAK